MYFYALILSLPTENATARQRIWRALKSSGAAVLRDGVYLMPDRENCRVELETLAGEVRAGGGDAHVLRVEEPPGAGFKALFDRSEEFLSLLADMGQARQELATGTVQDVLRQAKKLRKSFASLAEVDFFPGEAQQQAESVLSDLELACARVLYPDEPHATTSSITSLQLDDFQGRTWATRKRPWVDRLASAWLIRRFIDRQARLLWLASPNDCPPDALGFDFDGATFSHVEGRVTFEVLATSFALSDPSITRLGQLVHYLDIGGAQPPDAAGVESVLAGLRNNFADDDQLLAAAIPIFDGLLATYERAAQSTQSDGS